MSAARRRVPLAPRLALIVAGLLGVLLLGATALRSTETWITTDPEVTRRLLDLLADARRLKHDWEGALRGDARFALDTEIRVVGAKIAALEATTAPPRRTRGLDAWTNLPPLPAIVRDATLRIAETIAALALALVVCFALARLGDRSRRLALALTLMPLGLPPPVFAEAVLRLAAGLGLAPSPGLRVLAEILVGTPFAVALIWTATRRIDPREVESAGDLGFSTAAVLRRIALPVLTPALGLAAVVVFARLFDDVSLSHLLDAAAPSDRFGEWLRHRLVAAVDFPGGAAGAVLAMLATAAAATLLFVVVARRFTAPMPLAPRRPIGPPPRSGRALAVLLPPGLLVAGLAVGAVATGASADDGFGADRLHAVIGEIAAAALAAVLATALAAAFALACDRASARGRRLAAGAAFVAAALPAASVALALRLLADDAGLPAGPALAVLAAALAAFGFVAVVLLAARPPEEAPGAVVASMRRDAFLRRLAVTLPFAAILAFARTLAAADLGTVVGLVDRTALLRPATIATGDAAALVALVSAVATGTIGAWAIERLRRRPRTRIDT